MNIAALNKMGASRSNAGVKTGLIQGTLNTRKVQGNPELSGEATASLKCAETIHPASQTEEGNVVCMLCGLEFKRIMHFHTENKHDVSLQEYREMFPYAHMEGTSWLDANRKGHLGQTAWNRGLTKESDQRVADYSASLVGLEKSPEHCRKISAVKKGKQPACGAWNKGFTKETHPSVAKIANNKERNAAIGRAARARMNNPEYVSRLHSKMRTQQTKPEKIMQSLLDSLFPGQWLFTGDGKIVIDGLVPDFMNINGRKQLIEVFGDYWHRNENPEKRIDHFRGFGYSAIVFWEKELKDKELQASTVERLRNFCKDGERVRASGKPERYSHRDYDRDSRRRQPHQPSERCGQDNHDPDILQFNGKSNWSTAYHLRNCDNPRSHRMDGI